MVPLVSPCANLHHSDLLINTSCCVNDHFEALRSHMDHLPLRFQKLKCHLSQEYFEYGGQALVLTLQEGCEGKSWRRFVVKWSSQQKQQKVQLSLNPTLSFSAFTYFVLFNWNSYLEERLKPHWSAYSSHHLIGTHFDIGWFGPSSIGRDQAGMPIELPWWIVETQWFLSLLGYQGVRMFEIDLARFSCMANTSNTVAFLKRGKKKKNSQI